MREVDRALKLDPTNTEMLAQKQLLLAKQVETAKEKLNALKSVQDQVAQQLKNGDISEEAYRAFQREVAVAESNVSKLDSQLEEVSKTMNSVSDSTDELSDNVDDAGKETQELGKEVESSESKLKKFGDVAVTIGKTAAAALAVIGTAAVTAAKEVWDMSNDVASAGDEIDKTSQKIGISAESYQEWGYVFERCGANVDNLQSGMKKLSGVITEADKGSKSAKEKLSAVGLTIDDLNGKSQDEQLSIVISALQDMESGAERTAAANALLGKSATDMSAVLNTSAEETQALKDEAKEYGMIMSNETVAASAAFEDSLTKVNYTVTGLKNNMIGELLPGITQIMDGFADLIAGNENAGQELENGVTSVIDGITTMIPQFIDLVSSIASAILKSAPKIITALADGIINALPDLIPVVADIAGQLTTGLVTLLPQLVQSLLQVLKQLIQSLAQLIPTLIPQLTTVLTQIIQAIVNNLPMLLQAGLQLIQGLIQGIVQALPVLIQALPQLILSIVNFVLESIPTIIQAGIQLLTALVTALPDIINQIVAVLPQIITGIVDALLDNLPLIVQAGIDLLIALVNDLPTIISAVVDAIPQIVESVLDAVMDAVPKLIDAGIELFIALVDNLPAILNGIVAAIPKIISSVINALTKSIPQLIEAGIKLFVAIVQNLPKIISTIVSKIPQIISSIVSAFASLVSSMADVGRNMLEGLWNGISGTAGWLWNQVSGWAGGLWDDICGFFGIHSPSTLFRDGLGKNMALGMGEGFIDTMDKVNKDMQNALPTSFDINPEISGINRIASGLSEEVASGTQHLTFNLNVENFTNRSDKDLREIMDYAGRYFSAQIERMDAVF